MKERAGAKLAAIAKKKKACAGGWQNLESGSNESSEKASATSGRQA